MTYPKIVSQYRTSDGQLFETASSAISHQRVINWQKTFTEIPCEVWDPTSTTTLQKLADLIAQLQIEHGPHADLQLRANDMEDIVAYVRKVQS